MYQPARIVFGHPNTVLLGESQALKGFRNSPDKCRGITTAMLAGIALVATDSVDALWVYSIA